MARVMTPRATEKAVWAGVTHPTVPPDRGVDRNPGRGVGSTVSQLDDPVVSAVVTLKEGDAGGPTQETTARIKAWFGNRGFEVHAPFFASFSIGGRRSLFEEVFGDRLVVDQESLATSVTTADGGMDLSLEQLPDDIRSDVVSVAFMPPPGFG